ncbi:MAG: hypothetical protein K0R09_1952 [Clostridiales bacterium]|nr:hypothetical protein [Clostridiales bacterium]
MSEKIYSKAEDYDESQPDYSQNQEKENSEACQLEASLEYSLKNINEEASGQLYGEYMLILPNCKKEFLVKYREIIKITGENYRIYITLAAGEELIISCLGYSYEDFLRILIKNRNELILQDMLMYESMIFLEMEAEFTQTNDFEKNVSSGECIVRLYETGLIVIPNSSNPFRIPYSLISNVNENNYRIIIETDIGECITLSKIGLALEGFKKTYTELTNKLDKRLQATIQDLFPNGNSSLLWKLSSLIRDGKSVEKEALDSLSKDLWPQMEDKLQFLGLNEEYNYLRVMGQENKISIGIKKGLMGSLTGEYIWFLIPIYSISKQLPGNILAMEAVSSEDKGRATYFFKIMERSEYNKLQSIEELHSKVDRFILMLNYSMLVINFRREPIYLSKEQLLKPQYIKYLYSIENQPALKLIRKHFIGRVIHSNSEQWRRDVDDIIQFNSSEASDTEIWKRKK